jgi:hypothetical protein
MRWSGACSTHGEMKNEYKIRSENLKKGTHSEDLGAVGRTVLKWNSGNRVVVCGLDTSGKARTGDGLLRTRK